MLYNKGKELMKMPLSEARKKANRKYNDKAYDNIVVKVKKGKREKINEFAASKGMSTNGYINKLIDDDMKKKGEQE